MKKKITGLFILAFIFAMSSCSVFHDSEYKDVSYFQNLNHSGYFQEDINNYSPLKIQPADILGINVSSVNQDAASVFNTGLPHVNGSATDNSSPAPVYGYRVDANGDIQLPLVGTMKVGGLTTDEVAKQLTANLVTYLKSPLVSIRILNFKISVFGDVLRPDVFNVQNEHININEALSLAGDLNITAKRTNVLLVREQDGKRQFVVIDLTKKDLFTSPYYYLHNNDILYIDPDKTKYDTVSRSYKKTSLTLATLSVVAILVSAILVYRR